MRRIWFVFGLVLILAACQGLSTTPFPEEYSESLNLGDFELKLTCAGEGEPTLIFENALDLRSWSIGTPDRFKVISRTCIYQKYSILRNAEGDLSGARTAMDQVKDLHNLLIQAGVPGPYILIAHGTGSWNVLLYTEQYPKEVVGLVCVDCVPPGLWRTFFEKIETEQVDVSATTQQEIDKFLAKYKDYSENSELLDMAESSKLAEEVSDLGDRPFVVLAVPLTDPGVLDPGEVLLVNLWQSLDQKTCNLSSRCRYEEVAGVAEQSFIYDKSVDAAVKEVYEAVKKK